MYGMVHEGLGRMVVEEAGPAAWDRVCARAGLAVSTFPALSTYPDEVTVALVVAASAELGRSPDELLEDFGRSWVGFALTTAYGPLLRSSGTSLAETLAALDAMHARIALALPALRPPSFRMSPDGDAWRLRYVSERSGLAPFVVGLVHGLAEMHGVVVTVDHVVAKGPGIDHDEFRITPV